MDIQTVKEALGIDTGASDSDVLDKIAELRAGAGESFEHEPSELRLIRAGQHDQCCQNPDGSVTVTLLEPVKIGSDPITEITLRRPKLKDQRKAEEMAKGGSIARMAAMIQLLSHPQQAQRVIDELDTVDANVLGYVQAFLSDRRQRTGV